MSDATNRSANALLQQAVAHLNRNDATQAETLLAQVLAATPNDANALQLMGIIRARQGRAAEAETCYRRSIADDPAQPQVHFNLGNLLTSQGRLDEAIAAQREAIRLKPNYVEAYLGLALVLSASGDHDAAEKSCRQALRIQPNYQAAKQALATELNELGRSKDAEQILRQMLSLGVRDPSAAAALEHNLGVALKKQNRLEEALLLFDAARAKAPGLAALDINRGDTLQQLGRLEQAFESYRRALAIEPDNIEALASAALIAARSNDFSHARRYGERAVALNARHGIALITLAIADIEDGQYATAEERLRLVLEDAKLANNADAGLALGFAADAFDRHDRISSAFAVYSVSNERRRQLGAAIFASGRAIDEVGRLAAYFEKTDKWSALPSPPPATGAAAGHAFVLGFMRSGTTLLATVLASHAQVLAIDERELLTEPARAFLLNDAGLDRLAALDGNEIARRQSAYWNSVRDAGLKVAGKVFVDKMPFNSLRMPLIAGLFPAARVLFAIRDPRDVVLSCFRRRFDMTPYSFEFLRLEDCARFYASVMTLIEQYRQKLSLDVLEYRYEDMIARYDSTLRDVCDFLGLEWSDSLRDFSAAAGTIDRRSASAVQVRRGLYPDAVGQWRRYREQLAPVLPVLQPWVERFGYPPH
jgi:tetratricopeptide (TPR) repeat protein